MSNIFLNASPAPILSGAAEDLGAGDLVAGLNGPTAGALAPASF